MIAEIFAVGAGVAAHLRFFNHGEHHMYGLRYLQFLICAFIVSSLIFAQITSAKFREACTAVFDIFLFFLTGLYGSLAIYRLNFHPLKKFPGPLSGKLSSLCFSVRLTGLDAHRRVLALHQKYGDFLRIGSSDLSISHPLGPEAIYGRKSKCAKADWYDLTLPMTSMQTTRQRAEHDKRRRIWGGAFNDTIIKEYEGRIAIYQDHFE